MDCPSQHPYYRPPQKSPLDNGLGAANVVIGWTIALFVIFIMIVASAF